MNSTAMGILQKILVLIVVPAILYGALLPAMPLMEPDEGRYSAIPQEMNLSGDYVTPRLHGVVYLEKPPLSYWMTALFFRLFGETSFASRLWVGLTAWGMILLTYLMGCRLYNRRAGLFAAAVLGTSLYHFLIGRINILDMPLAFFVTLATWAGYRFIEKEGNPKRWLYLLYGSSALAFLTKGLIGVVFPFAILFFWLLVTRKWTFLLRLFSPAGSLIFLLIALPWVILAQWADGDFLWFFFVREHFLRYTTTMHGRENVLLYYVPVVILGVLPWLPFLWRVVRESRFREVTDTGTVSPLSFLLTWILFIFLFFTLSSSKLIPYAAPLFPPLAVLVGAWFGTWVEGKAPRRDPSAKRRWPVVFQSALFIAALVSLPLLKNFKGGQDLVILISYDWWLWVIPSILALAALAVLPYRMERFGRGAWFFTIYLLSAFFLGSLVFPMADFLKPYKSAWSVAQAAREVVPAGEPLYQFRTALYGIDFYNHVRTPIVDDFGELEYGMNRLPPDEKSRFFLTSRSFSALCGEKKALYTVTQYPERVEELKKLFPRVEEFWTNGAFYILRAHCENVPGKEP